MDISLFIGANGTGRSHTMIILAKILAKLGNDVLVIDTTNSQGIFNYFEYNVDVESEVALTEFDPIIREEISILVDNPLNCNRLDIDYKTLLENVELNRYNYIFIEVDGVVDSRLIKESSRIFMVQNSDKDKLIRNKKILNELNIDSTKLHFIFNQIVDSRYDKSYLLEELFSSLNNKIAIMDNEDVEIPFLEEDLIWSYENKLDGKISLKGYSEDFRKAMYELTNIITFVDSRTFKKITSERWV
ncbi:cobQ/CobB/MinD/ParA nucleotide binding domain protein [Clostridium argentinense CDC 2741]|uniref:CobQ/CobB/MinD/ParA nucleotide binding domain protein n=1 Tax=Clostridium argentinense CDC 2741 TaxID=1418104 RepID=A0A0C1QUF9_9CLOT|nr:hypothetical protein [Clostridium argentinense]ARC84434.1 hypothetical protein RSJ17_07775 [Clostridium argentinense]KIE44682.1 cobQ/CobB/MinD/ParA nucleotide binding domain protein [Clostridium argentinense CDC 2741]NFF38783.1 hypothetical protein [Clostridium argentinense]NFP49008.1 hypothetical protein [Clostridium argentinense]NFP72536.1 hypothetical protein [Clostridium argentinense]